MLTNLFIRWGWSRDDLKWILLQISTVAALISSNVFDVPYWCGYLGIPLSPTALHWIFALSALVLWISGRYNSSPLPSANAMASGVVPDSPVAKAEDKVDMSRRLPVILLAAVLAGGMVSGCALAPKPGTPADQVRIAQINRATTIVQNAGLVAEQAQLIEIQFHQVGQVSAANHVAVQKAFAKTADGVIVALGALQGQAQAGDAKAALQALLTGLDDLARAVSRLSPAQDHQLSLIISAARVLVEAATPLL